MGISFRETTEGGQAMQSMESWSWADQVSTYRFWALYVYFISGSVALSLFFFVSAFLVLESGTDSTEYGSFVGLNVLGELAGLLLAIAVVLPLVLVLDGWRVKLLLFVFAAIQLIGMSFLAIGGETGGWTLYAAGIFFSIGRGGRGLMVLAVVAGGRGGLKDIVILLGILFISGRIAAWLTPSIFAIVSDGNLGPVMITTVIGGVIAVGLVFLARADGEFFGGAPPKRDVSFPPKWRRPVVTGALALIPLYSIYHVTRWLYLIHGEAAHLGPSRAILTPRAAAVGAFVPFLAVISVVSLIGCLNLRASELDKAPYRSPVAVFLWLLVFPPVGIALTQSAINRLAEDARNAEH